MIYKLRNSLLFLLLFFSINLLQAQEVYEYVGGVKLNDSLVIPYKLNFTETNGLIKGYSLTDLGGEHETKSNIFGEYIEDKREFSFKEVGIVYTKSPVSQQDFCFLNFTAKSFVLGKTNRIVGNFIGLFSDNTECINGVLMLNSAEKVQARINKVAKKINKSKKVADSIKEKINLIRVMDTLGMNILRKNQTLSVFTKSKKVDLVVFDSGKQDGDRITIIVNGIEILSNYKANREEKIIPINITKNVNHIVIKANNEGSIAPNTIVVELRDNENNIRALSNLKTNDKTQIDILKAN